MPLIVISRAKAAREEVNQIQYYPLSRCSRDCQILLDWDDHRVIIFVILPENINEKVFKLLPNQVKGVLIFLRYIIVANGQCILYNLM